MNTKLIEKINDLLPQTQCRLCEHQGCRPYATAIVEQNEKIDRCLPGGERVLKQLGALLQQDVTPLMPSMIERTKAPSVAKVREAECIGCTKCIQACPVDAIIGAAKQMHVVLTDACNGCELCIEPCPVDCIDMLALPNRNDQQEWALAQQSRQRFDAREQRLANQQSKSRQHYKKAKFADVKQTAASRQDAIKAALARAKQKRKNQDEQ